MKNYVFKSTIFVFLSFLVFPCFSQAVSYTGTDNPGAGGVLGRPVTISYQEVRLEQALDMLEQAADITFIYSKDKIDINRRVAIEGNDTPLRNLLDVLCEKVSVHYRVQYDKVILSHKEESIKEAFSVSGQVVDGPSEEPLPGVNIRVKNMNYGTATDRDGRFILDKLTEDDILVFSFIGYEQKEVEVQKNTKDLLVRLYPQASQLSEVVVTALNITRERTRLGYAIQSLNGDNLSGNSETNVINTLSGKISGVRVTSAGGGIGSSSRIVIRGESSINGSNQPLFVVDGTPVDNSNIKSGTGSGFRPSASGSRSAIDFGNAISDLSPNDIESVSVLKGPNAAALYGSRAANGVVLIETKNGQGIEGMGVSVNSTVSFQRPTILPDYQNKYGQGVGDSFEYVDGKNGINDGTDMSFGPPLDQGLEFVQFNSNGEPAPWVSHPDNVKNFFNTGTKVSNNIAITGGDQEADFRLSITNSNETGMVPNTDLNRNNISVSTGTRLAEHFNARVNANYIKTTSDNRMGSGYDDQNAMKQFLWFGRQVDIAALKDIYDQYGNDKNWNTSWHNNPYFILYENTNALDRDRMFGNIKLSYNFSDRYSLHMKAGTDFYNDVRTMRRAYNDFEFPNGNFTEDVYKVSEQNYDFLFKGAQPLSKDLSLNFSAGGNWLKRTMRQDKVQARELAIPGVYNVGNARGIPVAQNRYEEKQVYSLYGLAEVGFRDYLFLEVTGRNDWSSTLPLDNNSYFYPSVSLSSVLTDIFDVSGSFLEYAKLRVSYAQVGSDTDPYQLKQVYNSSVANWGALTTVSESNTIPNADLKPQLTSSYELGADLRFLEGRLAFDLTWYDTNTRNQIISSNISASSGYSQAIFNAGKIQNKGIEISAYLKPLASSSSVQWDVTINYARNRNKVLELAEGVDRLQLPGGSIFGLDVVAVEGEPFGSFYGRGMKRNDEGQVIYRANGLPQLDEEGRIQGNYQPDWTGGISNTVRYKGFTLSALVDGSFGGEIYSGTNVVGRRSGVLASTLPGREEGIVGDGVVENSDGTYSPNTTRVPASNWYLGYYAYDNTEVSVFDATYIRLREVGLSYRVPYRLLQRTPLTSAKLSLIGRNLLFLYNSVPNIDPETAIASDIAQGIEVGQIPPARSAGLKLSVSF